MVAAGVKPYRLQRKTTLFKGGFLLMPYYNIKISSGNIENPLYDNEKFF